MDQAPVTRLGGWPRPARYGVDLDGTRCAFQSNNCTDSMVGAGGFDQHHEWPVSLGGDERLSENTMLLLCPNHHRRQHALIRYLAGTTAPDWAVLRHFTAPERATAEYAVNQWRAAGQPTITGWSAPAARDA